MSTEEPSMQPESGDAGAAPQTGTKPEPNQRGSYPRTWVLPLLTAIAAIAATAASVAVIRAEQRLIKYESEISAGSLERVAAEVSDNPRSRHVTLTSSQGTDFVDVVLGTGDRGFVLDTNLQELSANQTYQLWAESAGAKVSLGVLGRQPSETAFTLPEATTSLSITIETAPGSLTPSPTAVVSAGRL